MVQNDLKHGDFIEVRRGVVIDPFDQVLTTSVVDSTSHRARGVQGGKSTAKDKRSNKEGSSAGHRTGAPTGYRGDGRGS